MFSLILMIAVLQAGTEVHGARSRPAARMGVTKTMARNLDPICGTTPYDPKDMICCKDILHQKPHGMATCCGSEAMDLKSQICCDNVVNRLPSEAAECCGSRAYDLNLFQCIAGKISANTEKGCPAKYNSYKHICCSGHVYRRSSMTMACCGNMAYDSHSHECCDGVVAAKHHESHGGCCGKQVFNSDSHICCSGVLQKRGKGVSVCCGTNLQDAATQICCNGRIQDKHNRTSLGCCMYSAYSTDEYHCCEKTIHKKQEDGYNGCCNDLSINTRLYECAGGEIVRKSEVNHGTCGHLSYDTDKQMCCRGRDFQQLQPRLTEHSRCCGPEMVDNTNVCCAGGEVRLCGQGCRCAA